MNKWIITCAMGILTILLYLDLRFQGQIYKCLPEKWKQRISTLV
ncbi:hypothetical protein [Oceanobacillus sp. Castelsardo]|nr:hypothetical protein [Oceanobacillus sp. Castelsardo]